MNIMPDVRAAIKECLKAKKKEAINTEKLYIAVTHFSACTNRFTGQLDKCTVMGVVQFRDLKLSAKAKKYKSSMYTCMYKWK